MAPTNEFARFASPNERRCITREDLGIYHGITIGVVYDLASAGVDLTLPATYFGPLRQCVEKNPYLCVIVRDPKTEKSFYERVPEVDLSQHVFVATAKNGDDERTAIEKTLGSELDKPFPGGIPPWRIAVLPLSASRCLIAFTYAHSIGDGISGPIFHRNFLEAWKQSTSSGDSTTSTLVKTPTAPLSAPLDTTDRIRISWSFLLGPLISEKISPRLGALLGLPTTHSAVDEGTWTGSAVVLDLDNIKNETKIRARQVDSDVVRNALAAARSHDAKLTGLIGQLISRALSSSSKIDKGRTNFVAGVAINMRPAAGLKDDEMGNFVSGAFPKYPRVTTFDEPLSDSDWALAKSATRTLSEACSRLNDQTIGLLRYLSSIRNWVTGKNGDARDCSFEISNLGAADFPSDGASDPIRVSRVWFAQPGHVISAPLAFNFASVKDGGLTYTVTWQAGALTMDEGEEYAFVDGLCERLEADLKACV